MAALLDSDQDGRWAEDSILTHEMAGPHLVLAEISNILRRAALAHDVSDEQASLAHADLAGFDIELFPFEPSASRVWQLRQNLTTYDAWYIAPAESLDCPLFTLDTRLARAAGNQVPGAPPARWPSLNWTVRERRPTSRLAQSGSARPGQRYLVVLTCYIGT